MATGNRGTSPITAASPITADYCAGNHGYLESGNILAGNPKIYSEMLRRIQQPHLMEDLRY